MDELTDINCSHGGTGILWDAETKKIFCVLCAEESDKTNKMEKTEPEHTNKTRRSEPLDERHKIAIAILDNVLLQLSRGYHPKQLVTEMYKCNKIAADVLSEVIEQYEYDPHVALEQIITDLRECFYECDPNACKWPEDQSWPGEVCKKCEKRNTTAFSVPDDLWAKVVGDPNTIRCLSCFDEEAEKKGIEYKGSVVTGATHISWSDWIEE